MSVSELLQICFKSSDLLSMHHNAEWWLVLHSGFILYLLECKTRFIPKIWHLNM